MPNSIALFKNYVPILDEVYREASRTAVLDGAPELARAGANAGELIIPKMTMDGLADYARASGYVDGNVTLTNETVLCNFDRGRMFTVDALDDAETAGIAFGRLASEFIRTRVVPELDAFRFACYAAVSGIGSASGDLADGASVISALRAAARAAAPTLTRVSAERVFAELDKLLETFRERERTWAGERKLWELRREKERMQSTVDSLESENGKLREALEKWKN